MTQPPTESSSSPPASSSAAPSTPPPPPQAGDSNVRPSSRSRAPKPTSSPTTTAQGRRPRSPAADPDVGSHLTVTTSNPPLGTTDPSVPTALLDGRSALTKLPPPRPGPGSDWIRQGDPRRLDLTLRDFRRFLEALPVPVIRITPRLVARFIAKALARNGLMASNIAFDIALIFWRVIISIFFRSIQPRSVWRIPREGPIIFVAAPHHNQFLDPLLLASEVRRGSGRRVAFLIAEKSIKRRFIGAAARLMQSIPVARAADSSKPGKGRISVSPDDAHIIIGHGSQFTKQLVVRGQITLPKSTGYAAGEVAEIISDTQLRLKKEFKDPRAIDALHGRDPKDERKSHKIQEKAKEVVKGSGDDDLPGCTYQVLPFVDQTEMYSSVYERLAEGGCLGIFPEGGSHDRTDLLPLKAGVVIMALGAMSQNPGLNVKIVPVGLSYFHPHKFRSRAVVEFGAPLEVPQELVKLFDKGGDGKKKAVGSMMDLVYDGLKSVTVRAPDYETLMLMQAARRLYTPPGSHPSLSQVVELNRRFIVGYLKYQHDPRIIKLKDDVMRYNKRLLYVGLKDHQVERATRAGWKSLGLLGYRLGLLAMWGTLALPGVVLNAPIIILAKVISHRKAKEALAASQVKLKGRDVLATWKVLVSLGLTPVLYGLYAVVMTVLAHKWRLDPKHRLYMPLYTLSILPVMSYSTLKFSEVGIDIYKSLPPLFVSLLPGNHKVIMELQQTRARITRDLHVVIDELAPQVWDDFQQKRLYTAPAASAPPSGSPRREVDPLWQQKTTDKKLDGTSPLSHPLAWVDERLFGWGPRRSSSTSRPLSSVEFSIEDSGKQDERFPGHFTDEEASDDEEYSSATEEEEEEGDYEAIFRMITRPFLGGGEETPKSPKSPKRHSRSRSRSGSGGGGLVGESFADKRQRSSSDLRKLSSTIEPLSPGVKTTALASGASGTAQQRPTRTHSLSEEVRVQDLPEDLAVNGSGTGQQGGGSKSFTDAARSAEAHAKPSGGKRPAVGEMRSAEHTPDVPGSPQ